MATTTNRHYRYSALSDLPNGPAQIEALAEDIDVDVQNLASVPYADQAATVNLTTAAQNLAGLTLGSGMWLLSGDAQFDWSIAAAGRLFTLRLATATTTLRPYSYTAALTALTGSALSVQRIPLSVAFLWNNTAGATAVSLQAYMGASGGTCTAYQGHIQARAVTF